MIHHNIIQVQMNVFLSSQFIQNKERFFCMVVIYMFKDRKHLFYWFFLQTLLSGWQLNISFPFSNDTYSCFLSDIILVCGLNFVSHDDTSHVDVIFLLDQVKALLLWGTCSLPNTFILVSPIIVLRSVISHAVHYYVILTATSPCLSMH